jgi:hypothetical protein
LRELPAVAHAILRQVHCRVQAPGQVQRGLDPAGARGVDDFVRHTQRAQQRQPGLRLRQFGFAAQQDHIARHLFVLQMQVAREFQRALAAEARQIVHGPAVGLMDLRAAGAPPLPQPGQVGQHTGAAEADRRMPAQQVADDLGGHAGRGPGRDVAGGDHTGVGEAGFFGHAAAALIHRDLVTLGRELVGRGDANDARTDDSDSHYVRPLLNNFGQCTGLRPTLRRVLNSLGLPQWGASVVFGGTACRSGSGRCAKLTTAQPQAVRARQINREPDRTKVSWRAGHFVAKLTTVHGGILDPTFGVSMSVSMREMLEAGVHFGHQTRFWNPKMAPYIYGHRNKIHIINLEKTQPLFDDAMKFIRQLSSQARHHPDDWHQAPGARGHRAGSPARRHAFRRPALAGRHADQLQDRQGFA